MSEEPVITTYGGKEYVFQPKSGGHYVMKNEVFPDPRSQDPDPDIAKAFRKATLSKRVPKEDKKECPTKKPNWCDVSTGFVDFMRNGSFAERLAGAGIELKTLEELDKTHDSLLEDKQQALVAADREIAVREQRIAELKAKELEIDKTKGDKPAAQAKTSASK